MATKAHSRAANETSTGREAQQIVDGRVRVRIIRLERLLDLELVPLVGIRGIILEGLRAHKVMVRGRRSNDIALPSDLAGESGYRTSHCGRISVPCGL